MATLNGGFKMSDLEDETLSSYKPKTSADAVQIDGNHYKNMSIEPWEVMESILTHEEFIGFLKGNIIKYSMRDGKKAGAYKDAEKARHYMDKLNQTRTEW